jgi:hypothetical protein
MSLIGVFDVRCPYCLYVVSLPISLDSFVGKCDKCKKTFIAPGVTDMTTERATQRGLPLKGILIDGKITIG